MRGDKDKTCRNQMVPPNHKGAAFQDDMNWRGGSLSMPIPKVILAAVSVHLSFVNSLRNMSRITSI